MKDKTLSAEQKRGKKNRMEKKTIIIFGLIGIMILNVFLVVVAPQQEQEKCWDDLWGASWKDVCPNGIYISLSKYSYIIGSPDYYCSNLEDGKIKNYVGYKPLNVKKCKYEN